MIAPRRFARLLFIGCVVAGLTAEPSSAQPPSVPSRAHPRRLLKGHFFDFRAPRTERQTWSETVEGDGDSKDLAAKVALVRAQAALEQYLLTQEPEIPTPPRLDYIDKHLIAYRHETTATDAGVPSDKRFHVEMTVQVTDSDFENLWAQYLQYNDDLRKERVDRRLTLLAQVVAVLVALMAAFAGYFRLEEATKGYYTTWLRLGALGFVSAVVALVVKIHH